MAQKKEVTEHKMCVLISSTTFVLNISHSEENSVRHYPLLLPDISEIETFFIDFLKVLRYQISWKSIQ